MRHASQRMANSRSAAQVVRQSARLSSPTTRSRSRTSAKAQRSPPSASTDGNERRTPEDVLQGARARVAKLEIAISAAGRVRPDFSSTPRGSEASTEASAGPTCGESDQVVGVLHRADEEARGECSEGGGRCEAQGCQRRDDIGFRDEFSSGRRTAACSPLGGSIQDVRAATTHDARGFRSRIVRIEVLG